MARLGRNGFLAIAVVFHLVYVYSIFDIYFVSPIVTGMAPQGFFVEKAPAKRLVLFVGMVLYWSFRNVHMSDRIQVTVFAQTRRSSLSRIPLLSMPTIRKRLFLGH
jgi:hypothetical protein